MQIKDSKDFWSGAMFMAFGAFAFAWSTANYPMEEAFTIGPGVMPAAVGVLLVALGLVIALRSLRGERQPIDRFGWRSLIWLPVSTVAYGYLLSPLGLVVATMLLVLGARFGGRDFSWIESILLGTALAVFSVAVFVYALAIPVPVWPTMFGS